VKVSQWETNYVCSSEVKEFGQRPWWGDGRCYRVNRSESVGGKMSDSRGMYVVHGS
jgi:hypothetical protein